LDTRELEKSIGMRVYGTETPSIGGRVRTTPEDFIVKEVLRSGEIADVESTARRIVGGEGDFLLCILVKSGYDTFTALKRIARALHVSAKRISPCGLKDANALTAQHITIRHVEPSHLAKMKLKGVRVTPTRFLEAPISAKSLLGNRFKIKIRDVELCPDRLNNLIVDFIAETDRLGGVPNFYGHQRFGTLRPITHKVGKHVVKREFEQAVLEYLTEPSLRESFASKNAKRNFLKERDARRSLRLYPRNLTYERLMLQHLADHEGDYLGALKRLPSRIRCLLLNAYQSFLFNEFLSERVLQKLPLNQVYEGDYVMEIDPKGLPTDIVKMVEAEDVESANAGIRDKRQALGLPVIGYGIQLSKGRQGAIEKCILDREGVTPRSFYIGPMHEVSAPGKYRPTLLNMREFETQVEQDETNPEKSSLTLQFFLPKESYATVVLRELMKPFDLIESGF